MRTVFIIQIVITLILGAGFAAQEISQLGAAGYGGGIAMLNAYSQQLWGNRAARMAVDQAAAQGMLTLYLGAVQRFIGTLVLFAIGLKWLALAPIPLIVTFAIAQFGIVFHPPAVLSNPSNS